MIANENVNVNREDAEYEIARILNETLTSDPQTAVCAWNDYCCNVCNGDEIYSMDEFDELLSGMKPWDVARAAYFGRDFNPTRDYWKFNAYGNLESFEGYELDRYICPGEMAEYAVRNDCDFYCDAVREILDEYAERRAESEEA